MRNFREYDIYVTGMKLTKRIYRVTENIVASEKYGLTRQMRRAAVSIPSNIAEGASRASEKDFARFLEMAVGSAFELETQLILATDLEYIKAEAIQDIMSELSMLQKQIHHLIKILRDN